MILEWLTFLHHPVQLSWLSSFIMPQLRQSGKKTIKY